MAVFVPAAGWCAERFGARTVFAVAIGVFTGASLLCALTPTFPSFVVARVLQGAAAAFMSPVGRLVVLRETPTHGLTGLALACLIVGLTQLGEQRTSASSAALLTSLGAICAALAVWHARRVTEPMLDLQALGVHSFRFAVATAGFASRIAINAAPYLLPLMFQMAFHMTPLQAGTMVLVYMMGNLVMKSTTTAVLHRFGFRTVLAANGALCAASLFACGLIQPGHPAVLIHGVLFTADVPNAQRAGASALSTMLQQTAMTLSVALAAFVLGASQSWRGAAPLSAQAFTPQSKTSVEVSRKE